MRPRWRASIIIIIIISEADRIKIGRTHAVRRFKLDRSADLAPAWESLRDNQDPECLSLSDAHQRNAIIYPLKQTENAPWKTAPVGSFQIQLGSDSN